MKKYLIQTLIFVSILSNVYSQNVQDPLNIQGYWEESNMGSVYIGWDGTNYVLKSDQDPPILTKFSNNVITYKYINPGLAYNPSLPSFISGSIIKKSNEKIAYNNVEYNKRGPLDEDSKILLTSNYSNFNVFYTDFKKTVLNNNKQVLSTLLEGMIYFPFVDFYKQVYKDNGLSCKYSSDFGNKYKQIFTATVLSSIKEKVPYKVNSENLTEAEKKAGAEYVLNVIQGDYPSLLFGKINGRYMLIGIKYFE